MNLPKRQTSNEVKSAIMSWVNGAISNVHTALPGTIVSYDAGSNRASVQPFGAIKTKDARSIAYPVIYNAPVQFPCGMGGRAGVTFPIRPGDGCIVLFAEGQMDDYLSGGDSFDGRKHSLNDAMIIPGMYSGGATTASEHPDDVVLTNGSACIRLGADGFGGNLADGTSFQIGGGDLVVNGISHSHHTHLGDSGGTTGEPR